MFSDYWSTTTIILSLESMDQLEQLSSFIRQSVADTRLKPVHLSVCLALINLWINNRFVLPYAISRKIIMRAARIRSIATYHKVIRELAALGYITYNPSYHPVKASSVLLRIPKVNLSS
jgi:hypothetical protein